MLKVFYYFFQKIKIIQRVKSSYTMDQAPNSTPDDDLNNNNSFDVYRQRAEADETPEQSFEYFGSEWLLRSDAILHSSERNRCESLLRSRDTKSSTTVLSSMNPRNALLPHPVGLSRGNM